MDVYNRAWAAFRRRGLRAAQNVRSRGRRAVQDGPVLLQDFLGWVPALQGRFGSAEAFAHEGAEQLVAQGMSSAEISDVLESSM